MSGILTLFLAGILFAGQALAAVNPSSLGGPKPQYVDLTGAPASGYQLFWYVGGSTSTKQNTYTDATGLTANPNPIVLNSLGEPANGIFFQAGLTYKAVLASPTDTDPPTSPIWTVDNIKGINDTTVTQSQWVAGPAPTFVSGTSFTLAGDQTSTFTAGLRLQIVDGVGTKYATVNTAAYNGSTLTTVTTINDGGLTLQNPLSAVSYGLLSASNLSIPRFIQAGSGISVIYNSSAQPVIAATAPAPAPFRNWFVDGQIQAGKIGPTVNLSTSPQYGASLMIAGWASGGAVSGGTLAINASSTIGSVGRAVQFTSFTTTGSGVLSARTRLHSSRAVQLKNKTVSFLVTALQDTGSSVNFTVVIRKPTAKDNYASVTTIGTSGATSVPTGTATPVPFSALALGDCSNGLEIEVQAAVGAVTSKNVSLADFVLDLEAAVSNWALETQDDANKAVGFYVNSTFPDGVAPAQAVGSVAGAVVLNPAQNTNPANLGEYQWAYPMLGTPVLTTYNPISSNANWRDVTASVDRTWSAPSDLNSRHTSLGSSGIGIGDQTVIHLFADARL